MIRLVREYFKYIHVKSLEHGINTDNWIYSIKFCSFIQILQSREYTVPILRIVLRDYEKESMYPNLYDKGKWVKLYNK